MEILAYSMEMTVDAVKEGGRMSCRNANPGRQPPPKPLVTFPKVGDWAVPSV